MLQVVVEEEGVFIDKTEMQTEINSPSTSPTPSQQQRSHISPRYSCGEIGS